MDVTKVADGGAALRELGGTTFDAMVLDLMLPLVDGFYIMHNGSANTLADAVDYHVRRFAIRLSPAEKSALIAFLSAL